MANTPFIQFPCGEWAPGHDPDAQPCNPLIPGDCDDIDIRHPTCTTCGPHCYTPDCCIGPDCNPVDPQDPAERECFGPVEECDPTPVDPIIPEPIDPIHPVEPVDPVVEPISPVIPVIPPRPGGVNPVPERYIELCPCAEQGGLTGGCIKYVGDALVDTILEQVAGGCTTVILDGPEGAAGGGCQVTQFIPPQVQWPAGSPPPPQGPMTPWTCEVCPCWIIGDVKEGVPECQDVEGYWEAYEVWDYDPQTNDDSGPEIKYRWIEADDPRAMTNNINSGKHCPEEFDKRCCPKDCEDECPLLPTVDDQICPGCKPADPDEPVSPVDPVEPIDPPTGCFCEIKKESPRDVNPTITSKVADCEGMTCQGGQIGANETDGWSCMCCEVKMIFTFPQACREVDDLKHGDDGGAEKAEDWHKAKAGTACGGKAGTSSGYGSTESKGNQSACKKAYDESDSHTSEEYPGENEKCFDCTEPECTWNPPPGGECECEDVEEEDEDDGTGTGGAGGGGGGGGVSPTSPGEPSGGGDDICPDAKYECCWLEIYCDRDTLEPVDPYAKEPVEPITEDPCFCVVDDIEEYSKDRPEKCEDDCCPEPCAEGEECKGKDVRVTFKRKCQMGAGGGKTLGAGFCGCELPDQEECKCDMVGVEGNEECPDVVIQCSQNCDCEGKGDDNIIKGGPCDEDSALAGAGHGRSGGNGGGNQGENSGVTGGLLNHEVGGDTYSWDSDMEALRQRGLDIPAPGPVILEGGVSEFNSYDVAKQKENKRVHSRYMNSPFQVNLQAIARSRKTREEYKGDLASNVQENKRRRSVVAKKGKHVVSIDTEVVPQPFARVFNTGSRVNREQRTHGAYNLYDDNLNLFNVPRRGGFSPAPNDKWLNIFRTTVHEGVKIILDKIGTTETWDESYLNDLALSHIRKSLNKRTFRIFRDFKRNRHYGITKVDFLRVILSHLVHNTLDQFDLDFYESFTATQAEMQRFKVDIEHGTSEKNQQTAIQLAMAYARALNTDEPGINSQLSKMYRTRHDDKNSRVNVVACSTDHSVLVNSRNQVPLVCSDGSTKGLSLGSVVKDGTSFPVVTPDCTSELSVTSETDHIFRLSSVIREKVLALMGVAVHDTMYSETAKSAKVELEYSLNEDGASPREDYYFFKPDYESTETTEYYDDNPFLTYSTRKYILETNEETKKSILEDQLGGKIIYLWWNDLLLDHMISSQEFVYNWVDFTLKNFGQPSNSDIPIIAGSEFPYIIVIPTARSGNNPHNIYSELYLQDAIVGRRLQLGLHVDRKKIASITNANSVLRVEDDGT